MQLDEGCEGAFDPPFGAGLQDSEPDVLCARLFVQICNQELAELSRTVRVYQQGNNLGLRNQVGQQLEPLGRQLADKVPEARDVAARLGETSDEAQPDWVADAPEENRDSRSWIFCGRCG